MIHSYVVNLERDAERRQAISAQLDALGLPYTVCKAVDGRKLAPNEAAKVYDEAAATRFMRPLSRGELGCALSHLNIYRSMLDEGRDFALALEDDAALGASLPGVLEQIERVVSPDEPVAILLTHVSKYARRDAVPLGPYGHIVGRYGEWWLTHGYVITRAAARRMLDALQPVWCTADLWSAFEQRGIVRTKAVVPYCIGLTEMAQASGIEANRAMLATQAKQRRSLRYYLRRYLYQKFIRQVFIRPFLQVAEQRKT